MVYAGIYGSSLVNQDKALLKNLGMTQNKLLSAQEQRNVAGNQVIRKRNSKSKAGGKNVKKHYEHLVVNGQQDPMQTLNSSVVLESVANVSTKRGVLESDLSNSRELSGNNNLITNSNQPTTSPLIVMGNKPNIMIEQQESKEYDVQEQTNKLNSLSSPNQEDNQVRNAATE